MGIMCETCRKVLFAATWRAISPSERDADAYELACKPPCRAVQEFRKADLRPYRVSDDVFQKGYAEESEYELVQPKVRNSNKPPQGR